MGPERVRVELVRCDQRGFIRSVTASKRSRTLVKQALTGVLNFAVCSGAAEFRRHRRTIACPMIVFGRAIQRKATRSRPYDERTLAEVSNMSNLRGPHREV